MAISFYLPLPTNTTVHLEDLYKKLGVDRASSFGTLETVWGGYCRAYLSFFKTCSLSFPIPEPLLIYSRSLVCPLLVKALEEGLLFGLAELHPLCLMKRNNQNPGTFLMSPRPGRQIIEGVPYHDEKWREHFFVFKVDQASMGNFDFSKLSQNWAKDIVHLGSSSMPNVLRGLIDVLRQGRPQWLSFNRSWIQAVFLLPSGDGKAPAIKGTVEREMNRSLDQEDNVTPSPHPSSSSRLNRRLSRRSSFRTSRLAPGSDAMENSPLIPILDSEEENTAATRKTCFFEPRLAG
ncbi:hypothetical protein N665_0349s0015 [Sinapis alba]|nr:hypothetical protein N665_0349s0015 [Sinapis alba]